ncbi:MAG: hypothetical protein ACTSRU_19765, partial [Candidatus Hodarchaeales archaeon]
MGQINPVSEVCDGLDNDCDGTTDENVCDISGGSSSGSSGGSSRNGNSGGIICTEDWECGEWSDCIGGVMHRECSDANDCNTYFNQPEEEKECEIPSENSQENLEDCTGCECDDNCPNETFVSTNKFDIDLSDNLISRGKIKIKYDNSQGLRKSGMFFSFRLSDLTGNVVAKDSFGPVTIDANQLFEMEMSLPLYLLEENVKYTLIGELIEKGKKVADVNEQIYLSKKPVTGLVTRIVTVSLIIILILLGSGFIFYQYLKKGDG